MFLHTSGFIAFTPTKGSSSWSFLCRASSVYILDTGVQGRSFGPVPFYYG